MNHGKFQLLIAGIVASFKNNNCPMRKIDIKIFAFYVVFLFAAASCVGTKINKKEVIVTNVPVKIQNLDSIAITNIPILCDVQTDGENWVDSV